MTLAGHRGLTASTSALKCSANHDATGAARKERSDPSSGTTSADGTTSHLVGIAERALSSVEPIGHILRAAPWEGHDCAPDDPRLATVTTEAKVPLSSRRPGLSTLAEPMDHRHRIATWKRQYPACPSPRVHVRGISARRRCLHAIFGDCASSRRRSSSVLPGFARSSEWLIPRRATSPVSTSGQRGRGTGVREGLARAGCCRYEDRSATSLFRTSRQGIPESLVIDTSRHGPFAVANVAIAVLPVTATTIRLFLHVLGATVWVGGQLTLAGLVPRLRAAATDAPRIAARAFNRLAWPAFTLLVVTGVWNIVEIKPTWDSDYGRTLVVKIAVVAVSGLTVFAHTHSRSRTQLAVFGALTAVSAVGALFLGSLAG